MNPNPTLLTTLYFLLFSFTHFPISFTQDAEQVKDTNRNPLLSGSKYFIWPNFFGTGGEVRLGEETVNSTCSLIVLQEYTYTGRDLAVKFILPETSTSDMIYTGMELDIECVYKQNCAESSKWMMVNTVWIGIVGINDTRHIEDGKFKIEKHGGRFGYKLVYCPFNIYPPGTCLDIGKADYENGKRLVVTHESSDAFEVAFLNVYD